MSYDPNKVNRFMRYVREEFVKKIDDTAVIYTRDKNKYPYKVVKLKSGRFALVDENSSIIFKHETMHMCKVEFIMKTSAIEPSHLQMFTSKL